MVGVLEQTWSDKFEDLDALRIPHTVLLQAALHHPTPGGHPGGVVAVAVPGLLFWVTLVIDGDHSAHVDQNLDDDLVLLGVSDGVATGFLQISAQVDAPAEHPVFGLAEARGLDGSSALTGGAVVHDVLST